MTTRIGGFCFSMTRICTVLVCVRRRYFRSSNPAESNEIMAKAVGDWLKDPKVFADVLTGVKFYNQAANVKFFGTPQKPGDLYKVVGNALDIWGGFGKLQGKFAPKDLINHSFVK